MALALTIIAALCLLIWIYLAFARGGFWRLRRFDDDVAQHQPLTNWPAIVAVVPARNEAVSIRKSLSSLLRQDYRGEFAVVIVDDHSEDGTAQIAQQTARELGAEGRFAAFAAPPLAAGWTGKLWALHHGLEASVLAKQWSSNAELLQRREGAPAKHIHIEPSYFWLTDGDIVHAPDTLRRLVIRAEREKLDLASRMVLLQAKSLPERLLIPVFLFFFLKLYPPRWTATPRKRTAGAAGGCILLRREALERIGGLTAIRGETIDDCALARAVKYTGGRVWMGLTRASASLREYGSFGEIRDMIARTAYTQLRYSPLLLLGTVLGMLLVYLAPVALVFTPIMPARLLGACAWTTMTLLYLPTVRFYRLSPLWAPLLPFASLFYTHATLLSAVRHWLGRGAGWKGRVLPGQNGTFRQKFGILK